MNPSMIGNSCLYKGGRIAAPTIATFGMPDPFPVRQTFGLGSAAYPWKRRALATKTTVPISDAVSFLADAGVSSERVAASFDRIRVGLVLLSHLLELSKMTGDSLRDAVRIQQPQRTQWQHNGPRVAGAEHCKNSRQHGFVWCQLHYPSRQPALMCRVARKKAFSTRRRCGRAAVISGRTWAY